MIFEEYFRDYLVRFAQDNKPLWNYEAGVILLGAQWMYEATGEKFYKERIIEFMNHHILKDGTIKYLDVNELNLDKINSGKILFFLYEQTGEERYRKAIDTLMDMLRRHPRTSTGNFWHKMIYPYQIWLDGLYMALPFYLEYETKYNQKENYNDVYSQMQNVRRLMYSETYRLYYHAYDEKRVMIWSDKQTGLSHNFWLRSIGWHLMALIDLYEISSEEVFEQHKQYSIWFKEALRGILEYQDQESGLFYQLIALPDIDGNYLETSGSAMIAYSILKGCRLGVLQEEKYRAAGERIMMALHDQKMVCIDGKWHLKDICEVAGLGPKDERDGSIVYYLSEPIVWDEVKGVGAAMMAYAEYLKLKALDQEGVPL
ncbi:glycoside hydrolase family 88/105 protein [Lacrimispora brassicae]